MFNKQPKANTMNWRNNQIEKEKVVLVVPKSEGYERSEVITDFIQCAKKAGLVKSRKPALANYWDKEVVLTEMYEHDLLGMIKNRVMPVADIHLLSKQRDIPWAKDIVQKSIARVIEKKSIVLLLPSEQPEIQEAEIKLYKALFPDAQIVEW